MRPESVQPSACQSRGLGDWHRANSSIDASNSASVRRTPLAQLVQLAIGPAFQQGMLLSVIGVITVESSACGEGHIQGQSRNDAGDLDKYLPSGLVQSWTRPLMAPKQRTPLQGSTPLSGCLQ